VLLVNMQDCVRVGDKSFPASSSSCIVRLREEKFQKKKRTSPFSLLLSDVVEHATLDCLSSLYLVGQNGSWILCTCC